ncbi:hypothetical protein EIN_178560 [Entamoeba invadens IP1]|uniref:hypothetical protein n=1 Tax=Entamoeba invadens IP1 TaxID=370355 RepID=UPI0002C3D1C9|nr:hypothetical protein EIN_178560 [Entamoeba invadens IP1]ELP93909.1 hypothetical protein EIN_178560 [Entamoeba invadens IP1]|eukprot:XP_004260680.1 hypothetical protein EIN_178560 [Entamoeba invadens IP1]
MFIIITTKKFIILLKKGKNKNAFFVMSNKEERNDANIVMFGLPKVGKTTVIKDIVDKSFVEDYLKTDQDIPISTQIKIQDAEFNVKFFDTNGEALTSKSLTVATYTSNGTIHFFVMSSKSTDIEANNQIKMVQIMTDTPGYKDQPLDLMVIIVTKTDLGHDLDIQQAQKLAQDKGALFFELDLHDVKATNDVMTQILTRFAEIKGISLIKKPQKKKLCLIL